MLFAPVLSSQNLSYLQPWKKLQETFFQRDTLEVAPELLGKYDLPLNTTVLFKDYFCPDPTFRCTNFPSIQYVACCA